MIRYQRCSSHRPPVEIPQKLTSLHPENSSSKSLFWNILPLSPFGGRFCGHFYGPAFCFQYFADGGRRGVGQLSVASCQLSVVSGSCDPGASLWKLGRQRLRGDPCRPYGTRSGYPLYPALKRWAKLFRPSPTPFRAKAARTGDPGCGAGFPASKFHWQMPTFVLAQTLNRWARLFRACGAGFPANKFHWQMPTFVLAQTLNRWGKLFRTCGAGFPASKFHWQMPTFVLTQTLKRWAEIPRAHGIRFGEVRSTCRVGLRAATQSPEGTRSYLPLYPASASLFENCTVPEGDCAATCAAALRLNEILRLTRRSRAGLTSSHRFAAGIPQLRTASRTVMSVATQYLQPGAFLTCHADLAKSEQRRAKSLIGPRVATQYLQPIALPSRQLDSAKGEQRRAKGIGAATHAC